MQKALRLLPITLCLLLLLSSCSKDTGHSRYISKDAIGVVAINTTELLKKAAWNAISGSPIFKELSGGDTTKFDFEATGLDPMNTYYGYAVTDQRFAGKSRFMMIIPLKSADKFKAFIKEKSPEAKFSTKDKLNFVIIEGNFCIGWDDKTAIAATLSPSYEAWQSKGTAVAGNEATILTEEIQKTFALPEDQSMADNKKFGELVKANHDISFWLNYETLMNSMPQDEMGTAGAVMASQKKMLKDAYVAGGIDFEKGKITGDATYYFNNAVKEIAEGLEAKSVNNDLLDKVPGSQLNLMMSYHFNPKGIKTMAETMGVLPLANVALKEYGLSLDDVLNAFTGDFLLAVTDFSVATESQSYTMGGNSVNYTKPVPSFKASLSFKIKDKAAFDKLAQTGVTKELFTSPAPNTYALGSMATLSASNEYAVISNDPAVTSAFLGATSKSSFKVPADVKNNPYGFYLDIKNSIKSVPLDLLYGKEDSTVFQEARGLLESISAYGGKVKGDHSDFHFEVTFQNKEENSLMQLSNFFQKVAEAEEKEGDSFDEVVPQEDTATEATTAPAI